MFIYQHNFFPKRSDSSTDLFVYDLADDSNAAKFLKVFSLSKDVPHTSIVVYGKEFSYGRFGVSISRPGNPKIKINLGTTKISVKKLLEYVTSLEKEKFTISKYNLVTHNCHNFSNKLSKFLLNKEIPDEYWESGQRTIIRTVPIIGWILDVINERHSSRKKVK